MKKIIRIITLVIVSIILFTGCGTIDKTGSRNISVDGNTGTDSNSNNSIVDKNGEDASSYTFEAEVIASKDLLLVTPDKDSNEFKSSDKMSVGINDTVITGRDGEILAKEDINAGDIINITYNGMIAESYPAQITASAIEVIGHNILIDGYLALIDDIYQEDSGLNADITMIALDTATWVELTDIEKEIIFTKMKEIYGVDIIEGNFDDLSEQGLIDKDLLYFPSGILITIKDLKYDEKNKKINCAISKWRSGDGAIGSDDVTAKYKDGEWTIKKEGMWIS